MSEWVAMKWGDLATLEYGRALRGYQEATGAYRVYGTNGPIGWHSEALCEHSSVIVGRKGAYRGIHYSHDPFWVIDTAFYLSPKIEFDLKWAYYELRTRDINAMDSGSAIPSTSREAFYSLDVSVPPLREQQRIAHVLGTLDDKIELNRQMNRTLEAIARAIFKSWFIDFLPVRAKIAAHTQTGNPVHAKAEGRKPVGMDPETAALFPDSFQDSPLGKIPKGWEVADLTRFAKLESGKRPPVVYDVATKQAGIPVYGGAGVMGFTTTSLVPGGCLVTGRVGTLGQVHQLNRPAWPSDNTLIILPVAAEYTPFLHRLMEHTDLAALNSGSTQPLLTQRALKSLRFVDPGDSLLNLFHQRMAALISLQEVSRRQIHSVASLRDCLLPKLISGDQCVKDAERSSGRLA